MIERMPTIGAAPLRRRPLAGVRFTMFGPLYGR
jgi:hypothetical protein